MRCHSERSEESRTGFLVSICPTQNKIPRFARKDISFLGAREQTGMSDCSENPCAEGALDCGSKAAALEFGQEWWRLRCRTPGRFPQEGI